LAAELTVQGTVEIRIDKGLDPPLCKRKFADALHLIADPHTPSAEDAFVGVALKKRGKIIDRGGGAIPGITCFFNPVFIDQGLKGTLPFLFASGTDHRVVKEDELKLEFPGRDDVGRMGDDLHFRFCRSEAGRQEFGLPFLLNHTETACTEGDESPIMAEGGDPDPRNMGGLQDCFFPLYLNLDAIDF
jgi:hypothetical protein